MKLRATCDRPARGHRGAVTPAAAGLVVATVLATAVVSVLCLTSSPARAQTATGSDDDLPRIRIVPSGGDLFRLAVPRVEGEGEPGRAALDTETRDFDIAGIFHLLDPTSFPAELQSEGLGFSSALWSQVGAQGVTKMKVTRTGAGAEVEGRLYVLGRGEAPVVSHVYKAADARDAVHQFANEVIGYFTGQPGIFGSRIVLALSGKASHEIASIDADGSRTLVLTKTGSDCLLPAYSPNGGEVAFTSYLRNNPDLWIVSAGGGRARRVSRQSGLNTGANWSPDGRSIALTMSYEGNAELYRISAADGGQQSKLTTNPAIDSSPSYSADGSQIAFVSNRQGSPQIFVMPSSGGAGAKRVTFQGKYNQTPRWNPRADKPLIAFTGRDEKGVFDIFILDMRTGKIDRVTQSKGSNQDPTWSPDGRLLAYTSTRGGIFVTNPETRHEVQIWRGAASSPSWGPAPTKSR
jgi:TolB protein